MSYKYVCSTCRTDEHLVKQNITENFEIRGDLIEHTYSILECSKCGELVSSPEENEEFLKEIYDKYKSKHGLLLTEEIIAIRKRYGISLRDFSKILGVSHVTYHRYEKGAIPDPAPNNLLLLIKENPQNLMNLFELSKFKFPEKTMHKIQNKIDNVLDEFHDDLCSNCHYQIYYEQNYLERKAQMTYTDFKPYNNYSQVG